MQFQLEPLNSIKIAKRFSPSLVFSPDSSRAIILIKFIEKFFVAGDPSGRALPLFF
jgi:hypothetical protein